MKMVYFQTIHQLITTGHWLTDEISKALKEYGATEPQYNVLRLLKEADGKPLTVQNILDGMVQRSSNITRIVDKLINKGYVERKACPTNRRKMDITITNIGLKHLKKLDKKVYAFHQPMMNNLNSEELELLNTLIFKLKKNNND